MRTPGVNGFTAGQQAPWVPSLNGNLNLKLNDIYIVQKRASEVEGMDADDVMDEVAEDAEDGDINEVTISSLTELSGRDALPFVPRTVSDSSTLAPFGVKTATSTSSLRAFWKMARPSNFPGLLCFHFVGIIHALKPNGVTAQTLIRVALQPAMLATLLSLFLICSASMIVNDYYDGRSGLDSYRQPLSDDPTAIGRYHTSPENRGDYKPLVSGEITYPITKRFLSYLYAGILISVAVVPGPIARLSVVAASMLTFWYTQHIKPKTWLKNVSCAALIALAPFTSGSAAMHLLQNEGGVNGLQALGTTWKQMGRLTTALFTGIMGREIMMDIVDLEADQSANVYTVPVRYGRRFASKAALGCMMITAVLTTVTPLLKLLASESSVTSLLQNSGGGLAMIAAGWSVPALRRFCLAIIPSVCLVLSAFNVQQTEGRDEGSLRRTIEGSKICVLLLLASFL